VALTLHTPTDRQIYVYNHSLNQSYSFSVVNKDLSLKAKAKAKDLTFKAKAKDSKFVLEDTSRPRTTTLYSLASV